jgi:hypothetical protein
MVLGSRNWLVARHVFWTFEYNSRHARCAYWSRRLPNQHFCVSACGACVNSGDTFLAAAVSQQKSYFGRNQQRQTVAFLQSGRPIKSFACVCGCVKFNQVEMLFGQLSLSLSRCAKCVRTELQNLEPSLLAQPLPRELLPQRAFFNFAKI